MYMFIFSDIDECANPALNNCHQNANCLNIPGSYQCQCNIGYTGNGIQCAGKYRAYSSTFLMRIHTQGKGETSSEFQCYL